MGGESKAGGGGGAGKRLSVVDRGDGCGKDSSKKGGGMVNKMLGKWVAWMVGPGSEGDADVKSVRGSGKRG